MAELIVQSGKHRGKKLVIPPGVDKIVVGRDAECAIRLASSDISRRHCEFVRSEKGLVVKDLDSRNGTFVNGQRIKTETILSPGDKVQVGPLQLLVAVKAATKKKESQAGKDDKASDDDIASWLSSEEGTVGSDDTTELTTAQIEKMKSGDAATEPVDSHIPPPSKEDFDSIAEEAADIIRRHHEMKRRKAEKQPGQ